MDSYFFPYYEIILFYILTVNIGTNDLFVYCHSYYDNNARHTQCIDGHSIVMYNMLEIEEILNVLFCITYLSIYDKRIAPQVCLTDVERFFVQKFQRGWLIAVVISFEIETRLYKEIDEMTGRNISPKLRTSHNYLYLLLWWDLLLFNHISISHLLQIKL